MWQIGEGCRINDAHCHAREVSDARKRLPLVLHRLRVFDYEEHGLSKATSRSGHDVVVIGGSSGSIEPLRQILGALPADLPASVFVVLHLGPTQRAPNLLIDGHTPLDVVLAEGGARLAPGTLYLAPSDHHLALDDGTICVFRGPRENGSRPAIDTLFRSAAVQYRGRVVAVLLSGWLHDGTVGLSAVKRCGGTVIVQAPAEAMADEMPRRALQATSVDHCVPAAEIGPLLLDIVRRPAAVAPDVPEDLRIEAQLALSSDDASRQIESIGEPAQLVCPECSGPLWRLTQAGAPRFRCLVGHAFSPEAMLTQQSLAVEQALWVALRALKERGTLLSRMAEDARTRGLAAIADGYDERIRELDQHASSIHRLLAAPPAAIAQPPSAPRLSSPAPDQE